MDEDKAKLLAWLIKHHGAHLRTDEEREVLDKVFGGIHGEILVYDEIDTFSEDK